jgi:hypothetical protein
MRGSVRGGVASPAAPPAAAAAAALLAATTRRCRRRRVPRAGSTPLIAAAWTNQVEVVDFLLSRKANIDWANKTVRGSFARVRAAPLLRASAPLAATHPAAPAPRAARVDGLARCRGQGPRAHC